MLFSRRWIVVIFALVLLMQPAAVLGGHEVLQDGMQKERLNVFLSNFSEVLLQPFARNDITDQELIRFGILHTWANNPKSISHGDGVEWMSEEMVDYAADKYFGLKVRRHQSADPSGDYQFVYQDGYYYRTPSFFPEFAGQRFARPIYFTQISALIVEGDDCYTAYGDIYIKEPQSAALHSIYKPLEDWHDIMLQTIRKVCRVKATIRQLRESDGGTRFILLDYTFCE